MYLNYYSKKGENLEIVDVDGFSLGEGKFLLVTCENVDDEEGIYNEELRSEAKQTLGC